MRYATWLAAWLVAFGVVSCSGSETSNIGPTGGSGGAGGAGGGGGSGGGDASNTDGSSGAGGSDSGSGVTAEQACTETANTLCSKFESCAPFAVTVLFGDMATCTSVAKTGCLGSLQATQTAATPDVFMKCSSDLKMASCADVLSHNTPPTCRPKGGTVGNGMVCGDDWQCMSGRCNIPATATCGVCASLAPAGGSCPQNSDDECEFGLVCADNLICVAPGAAGAACDVNHPCAAPYVCQGATTTAQGTCAMGGAVGDTCTSDQGCSIVEGTWCTRAAPRTCAKIGAAEVGMACGFLGVGEFALCKAGGPGGGCSVPTGAIMGTCPRRAAPGEACSAMTPCKVGATCINGLCTVREPAACR
jgi:hypothetical protein